MLPLYLGARTTYLEGFLFLKMIGIYKITSPTGKIYIGQSVDLEKRFKDYKSMNSKTKRQTKVWRSFLKHGVENHIFEIIEECLVEKLSEREGFWQDEFDSVNKGLNCVRVTSSDKTGYSSKETRNKISLAGMGRKDSEEVLVKKRLRMIGNTYNTNRKRAENEKINISNTMKSLKINSKEKNPMWGKTGMDNPNCKIILDTQTGIFYFGIKEASIANNIPLSTLKKYMCNERLNKSYLIYC